MRRVAMAAIGMIATALLVACGGQPPARTLNVELTGEIGPPAAADSSSKVHVSLFHAWSLQGELRHPLQLIETFETAPGPFSHRFEYPVDGGEGLVVYAWLDLDGDGVLCTPTYRLDPAGLATVAGFPAERVNVVVTLAEPCRGPDWFYPPAPAASAP
jgi:hypothetical protein